jgi:ferredoxin-NADP reductase
VPSVEAIYFSEAAAGDNAQAPGGIGAGPVSVEAVWPKLRQPLDSAYYISGPPPMLRGIAEDLRARQVAAEAIHTDAWE